MPELDVAQDLLRTVPTHNFLQFYDGEGQHPKRVVRFLEFDDNDISKAIGAPKSALKLDKRIPPEVQQKIMEIGNICELVAGYFKGDHHKTYLWFIIPNTMLGGVAPRDMIRIGRYRKLLKFVTNALTGYSP